MAKKDYTSGQQDYMTPFEIYGDLQNLLRRLTGGMWCPPFDIDVCCSQANIPAIMHFYEWIYDGLEEPWHGNCFLNPPFKYTKAWVEKAIIEVEEGRANNVFCVLPADRLETIYYQNAILKNKNCTFAFLPYKRGFIDPRNMEAEPIPSQKIMIAVFSKDANRVKDLWNGLNLFDTKAFRGGF